MWPGSPQNAHPVASLKKERGMIARDCALYLLPSFLSFLLSFFSVFVSLIIRRLVSIALFERMDDVDGWTDDAR